MRAATWPGELLRWYLIHARHPGKNYIVGHYWWAFCKPRFWIRYGEGLISVCLTDYLQQRIFFDGFYEKALVDWLTASLKADDVFWDVGSNVGAVTLVAARHCRQVVAFEPDPRSLHLLQAHVARNGLSNVTVVPAALGEARGVALLHQAPLSNTGMTTLADDLPNSVSSVQVSVRRADDVFHEMQDLAPTVMKIDVEGREEAVLRGAAELLRTPSLRAVVFETDWDPASEAKTAQLEALFEAAGFAVRPFAASSPDRPDGKFNFLAMRQPAA